MKTSNSQPNTAAQAANKSRCSKTPHVLVLTLLLAGLGALIAPSSASANQVFKACGKGWLAKAKKLEPQKLTWLMQKRTLELAADLDADGKPDQLTVSSRPSFRNCDIKNLWNRKETSLRIDYASGKSKLYHWVGGGLVYELKVYPESGRILAVAIDADGKEANRMLEYRQVLAPTPEILLAELPAPALTPAEGTLQIASVAPLGE